MDVVLSERVTETEEVYTVEDNHRVELFSDGRLIDDEIYEGDDGDDAKIEFDNFDVESYYDRTGYEGSNLEIRWSRDSYRVKPNIPEDLVDEFDSIEDYVADYPIEELWNDSEYYTLIDDEPEEIIDTRSLGDYYVNMVSDDMLDNVRSYFYNKIHGTELPLRLDAGKYMKYDIGNGRCIQLRFADHSENASNIYKFESDCDYFLSVVIADRDAITGQKKDWFELDRPENSKQIYFDSTTSEEEIIDDIESEISRMKR